MRTTNLFPHEIEATKTDVELMKKHGSRPELDLFNSPQSASKARCDGNKVRNCCN
ncbi:hypothetical protein JCGZ_17985 [Jatropha curcas]|uniref:Uncharacterized protein n=1 Tax=Jatropha curcas TaxID=180498 RepID=A0A067JSH2_JATCU|nr:hypothetical protein JCGZ_17985 [Jatropha curcas]